MSSPNRNANSHDVSTDNSHPGLKVYTPRLEEFEEAVASATRRYLELPDWLRANIERRLRSK